MFEINSLLDIALIAFGVFGAVRSGWGIIKSLKQKEIGLDVLAVIAIVATLVLGEYVAAAVVVLMTLTGDLLEWYAGRRAKRDLSALIERAPETAHTEENGDIPVAEVQIGTILKVLPGEVIPIDGELLDADATLDESSLTGESVPVTHKEGEALLSGSVVQNAPLRMKTTVSSEDSQYQQIIELVKMAEDQKPPAVRLADQISVPFTVVSLIIGGAAWIITGEPLRFAEVLVLATPCPLLIAAPVAFLGGMSRTARSGVIVKGGGVLELLSRVKTAAFDKTGTVTVGSPIFERCEVFDDTLTEDDFINMAASVEDYSGHILASSIVQEGSDRNLTKYNVQNVHEEPGVGVSGDINGKRVTLTSLTDELMKNLNEGEIGVSMKIDNVVSGYIVLKDKVRPDSAETMKKLKSLGVTRTAMLTGDKTDTAKHIADQIGMTDVRAELKPAQKVEAVDQLKAELKAAGKKEANRGTLLMVGDGVNDAPALATADVGIAMGAKGRVAATQSADAVIMLDEISRVATAIRISQETITIAKQSMIGGIALSIALMLIATTGIIPPVTGALLQEVIDVLAIANGVRAALKK